MRSNSNSHGRDQKMSAEAYADEALHGPGAHDGRNGVLCALVTVAAIAITHPVAEMGFVDDWSYKRTAEVFAQTGHIVYNGWATASLGWLIAWGALFLNIFGDSFTAVRMSTVPLAAACVWLLHDCLRRFGISARGAVLGCLTLGLSPLFLPLSASFMTDVPGLFCILVCLHLCLRATAATRDRAALGWLALAAITNVLGGTVRQIVWLGALVMVPSTAWHLRHRRGMRLAGTLCFGLSAAAIGFCMHWFLQQRYALPEHIYQGPITTHIAGHMLAEVTKTLLCLALVCLPVLLGCFGDARSFKRPGLRFRLGMVLLVLAVLTLLLQSRGTLGDRVMPWLGHILGTESIFPSTGEMLGSRPVTINLFGRTLSSWFVVVTLYFAIEGANKRWQGQEQRLAPILHILGPFTMAYLLALLPRAAYSFIYDRYLLGLIPLALAVLLTIYPIERQPKLARVQIAVVAVFAVYAICGTHDWFALNRARVMAVQSIRHTGVPATEIQGGFDIDGTTQLQAAGYINDERILRPHGAYIAPRHSDLPPACILNFSSFTPAIHPRFFVVFEQMPCLRPASFPPVTYRTWLPPFHRQIYIQQAPRSYTSGD